MTTPAVPSDPNLDPRGAESLRMVRQVLMSLMRRGELVRLGRDDWTIAASGGAILAGQSFGQRPSYGMYGVSS